MFSEGLIIREQYLGYEHVIELLHTSIPSITSNLKTSFRKTSMDTSDDISFDGSDEVVHIQKVDEQCLQNRHVQFYAVL